MYNNPIDEAKDYITDSKATVFAFACRMKNRTETGVALISKNDITEKFLMEYIRVKSGHPVAPIHTQDWYGKHITCKIVNVHVKYDELPMYKGNRGKAWELAVCEALSAEHIATQRKGMPDGILPNGCKLEIKGDCGRLYAGYRMSEDKVMLNRHEILHLEMQDGQPAWVEHK